MDEEWREVNGYPKYEISNFGRLCSYQANPGHPVGRLLRGTVDDDSRRIYGLYNDKGMKRLRASRLVADAFIEKPKDARRILVIHNDGNPLNNHVSNLRWGSHKENSVDAVKHGTALKGEKCNGAKLTKEDVKAIRARYEITAITQLQLATTYNVTRENISAIIRRVNWRHV